MPPSGLGRFWLDSDRRLREVSRLLHRHWPLTAAYAHAIEGDSPMLAVSSAIPALRSTATTLDEAINAGLGRWVAERGDDAVLAVLHRYERLRLLLDPVRPGDPAEAVAREILGDVPARGVGRVPGRRDGAIESGGVVRARACPDVRLRGVGAGRAGQMLVAYRRERSIFADITDALRRIDGDLPASPEVAAAMLAAATA